jgi:hypothetical protein
MVGVDSSKETGPSPSKGKVKVLAANPQAQYLDTEVR